jgi:hypothetical protein
MVVLDGDDHIKAMQACAAADIETADLITAYGK